ncbi:MAG TPA: hypothetical protein VIK64_12575 [Anaerolineales bacterium]
MSLKTILLILICLALTACEFSGGGTPSPSGIEATASLPVDTIQAAPVSPTPTSPEPTPTSSPGIVLLLKPSEPGFPRADDLEAAASQLANSAGLNLQVRSSLNEQDLTSEVRWVIALPPDPGLIQLAAAAPQIQFLGIGIPGIETGDNLRVIAPQGSQPAETGFLAGFIAAVVTPEWRVGVISTSNNPAGIAARNGFLNGVIYFCGLCRQTYPPYEDYPLYVELPAGSSPAEWQATADTLRDRLVKTVYVAPGAGDQALLTYIAESDINIIGSGQPPEAIRDHWVASIQPDYLQALQQVWPELVNGTGAAELPTTIEIDAVNASLFSPGRQMLVNEFLNDLQNGYIDTGVDPVTGEVR